MKEPHRNLYDIDDPNNVLLISQWHHSMLTDVPHKPALLLINGKGRQNNGINVPLAEFTVKYDKKYRFRIANAGGAGSCPVTITIEKHSILLISLDGHSIDPQILSSLTLAKGKCSTKKKDINIFFFLVENVVFFLVRFLFLFTKKNCFAYFFFCR